MKTIEKCLSLALVVFGCINYNMAQSGITASTRQKEKKITIHPNPVVKVLNVLGVKDTEIAYIIVFDIYHNTVLQHEWKVKNNAINIPIADLEKRVYTLTIKSQVQRVAEKFYKQWCLIQTKSAAKYIDWII